MSAAVQVESQEPEIISEIHGNVGLISLNRPRALNSLNLGMIREMMRVLQGWAENDQVKFVVIEGVGDKAFCAGGDIRSVYQARLEGKNEYKDEMFREEYELNYYISKYPKPYVSLINGICMGGGMGVSVHGSHRIVTDKAIMAMPETGIGFFPDVGGSYFLNRCPGHVGMFMAITGEKISGADAIYAGLATHYVPSDKMDTLRSDLLSAKKASDIDSILTQYVVHSPESDLAQHQNLIDSIFDGKTIQESLDKLYASNHSKAYELVRVIAKKSPMSMAVTFTLLTRTKRMSLKKCLELEFRLSQKFVGSYDFFEGVRALLIDKDNNPKWQPNHLNKVKVSEVRTYFKDLGSKELKLAR